MVQDVNPPPAPGQPPTLADDLLLERFRNVCQKQQFFGELRRDYLTIFFKILVLSVAAGAAVVTASPSLEVEPRAVARILTILALAVNACGFLAAVQIIHLEYKVFGYREAEATITGALPEQFQIPEPKWCGFASWTAINVLFVVAPAALIWPAFTKLADLVPERERTGLVNFESTPEGQILIDGGYFGRTPAHGLRVQVGEREVSITAPGYSTPPVRLRVTEGAIQTHSVILTEDKK